MITYVKNRLKDPALPLFLTVFLDLLGFGIAIPVLAAVFLEDSVSILSPEVPIEIKRLGYGLLVAAYPFAQFLGAPVFGALSDRHGRKPILLITLFCSGIGYILFALGIMTKNVSLLFLSRLVDGFTGGNISIVFSAIADSSPTEAARTTRFGMIGMAFGLGFILGPYIGGKLADPEIMSFFTAATPFQFGAMLAFSNFLLMLFLFRETNHSRLHTPLSMFTGVRNVARAFTIPRLRTMFIVVFLLTLGFNFFTQFFPVILIEWFHLTPSDMADFFAYVGLWIAFTQLVLMRPVSGAFSPPTILRYTTVFLGLALFALLMPGSYGTLYFIVPFIAIFQGLTHPNTITIISSLSDESSQGEVMGINQSVQALAMMMPPLISGVIANIHLALPMIIAGALTILGWLCFVTMFHAHAKEPAFHEV